MELPTVLQVKEIVDFKTYLIIKIFQLVQILKIHWSLHI